MNKNNGVLEGELKETPALTWAGANVTSIMKQRRTLSVLVFTLIIIQIVGAASINVESVNASPKILSVPETYSTITEAIANASQGDTIIVNQGVYQENLVIDKSLTIRAEGNVTVVGEGGVDRGAKAVFTIAAESVSFSGFTIKSKNYTNNALYATGINLNGDNANIFGNTITGTYYGIFSSVQSFTIINANNITNTKKEGIRICGGASNKITSNTITDNAQSGIALGGYSGIVTNNTICGNTRGLGLGAAYSVVYGNNFTNNRESGIFIASSKSTITSNTFESNKYGIYFTSFFAAPNNNTFYLNNFVNNSYQVDTDSTYNKQIWDNGASIGGNYWSNYNNIDTNADGKGDSPYTVYADNTDRYPLITFSLVTANLSPPALPIPPAAVNGVAGFWHFDEIEPNGVTPDALGSNPVMLEPSSDGTFTPLLVEGKIGNALRFNGTDYAYVLASPSLDVKEEITIDAWVYVQEFKNVAYNNIVVECERTPDKFPTRILGFAVNGESPQNSSSPLQGALRGFMLDNNGVFNEIVTTKVVISLNHWIHVVFVRSVADGMHIYVNDIEENVYVTSGDQNPTSAVARGTEFYIGHDSVCILDEVSVSTTAVKSASSVETPIWAQWYFLAAIGVIIVLSGTIFLIKRSRGKRLTP